MTDDDFALNLDVWYGWCTLRLSSPRGSVELRGHWFSDCFTDLVDAVADVLGGRRTACCRFQWELAGGGFVDLSLDYDDGICVAVHETAHGPEARTGNKVNSAARGALLYETRVELGDFVRAFVAALRRIRVRSIDASGLSIHWPHTFPQSTYERMERAATSRFGYKAEPTYEITGEDPRPWPRREPPTSEADPPG